MIEVLGNTARTIELVVWSLWLGFPNYFHFSENNA